ncbi:SMI1/KNR4 family protein [Sphingobacterium faecale]|uniref:SMI1/KNR4 family protein n=1 Tax=Sphingobacterium faecale TaxID=2803775 RepID=A0ABS1R0Y6_9SPHI|nr:SMI1/KNR4 family protein [Sphingobacterium faecale]MBL1407707.1 SMI1/KNR4 family protein [Sphingobacterium faecale]
MKDYQLQIKRIKDKLVQAKIADKDFKVFGADAHLYKLNAPVDLKTVEDFERQYDITLPIAYKLFVTEIGSGGVSYNGSGAGPYYGLYPFGEHFAVSYGDCKAKQIQSPAKISPNITKEKWQSEVNYVDEAGDDDSEFDKREAALWGGIFIIGTQGCTFHHALLINGPHMGRIVNIDDGDRQLPQFSFESDFLDWYERWLDDVIEGNLSERNSGSFGYQMGGRQEDLLTLYSKSHDLGIKQHALEGLLFKKKLSPSILSQLEQSFDEQSQEIQSTLTEVLLAHDYILAVPYLDKLFKSNINRAVKLIHSYAKEHKKEWVPLVKGSFHNEMDEEAFRFASYILQEDPTLDFEVLKPFVHHENPAIRSQVFYTFSFLKDKSNYEQEFLIGLDEPNKNEIITVLQSLGDFKTKAILKKLQELVYKFPYTVVEPDEDEMIYYTDNTDDLVYITSNLESVLARYDLDHDSVKTIDVDQFELA